MAVAVGEFSEGQEGIITRATGRSDEGIGRGGNEAVGEGSDFRIGHAHRVGGAGTFVGVQGALVQVGFHVYLEAARRVVSSHAHDGAVLCSGRPDAQVGGDGGGAYVGVGGGIVIRDRTAAHFPRADKRAEGVRVLRSGGESLDGARGAAVAVGLRIIRFLIAVITRYDLLVSGGGIACGRIDR